MYRPSKPVLQATNAKLRNELPVAEIPEASGKYELLWRKKTAKVHKTWEGDAEGRLTRSSSGRELLIDREGRHIATIKLNDEDTLSNGTILSSGGLEFEISGTISCSNPNKRLKVNPQPVVRQHLEMQQASQLTNSLELNLGKLPLTSSSRQLGMVTPFRSPLIRTGLPKVESTAGGATVPETALGQAAGGEHGIDPQLQTKLRPHQIEGVLFLLQCVLGSKHSYGNGAILADEMGLGKTLSAIALLHTLLKHKKIRNAIIVCPVSLVANWRNEFAKWLPASLHIAPPVGVMTVDQNGLGNGSLRNPVTAFFSDRQFKTHQIMIVGYERMRILSSQISAAEKQFDMVVCDEGHRLKSVSSKTAESIAAIAGDKRVLLTGTPIQNDLREFWALAEFVNPGVLGKESQFQRKYAEPISRYVTTKAEVHDDNGEEGDQNDNDNDSQEEDRSLAVGVLDSAAQDALQDLTEICDEFMLRRTTRVIEQYISVSKTEYVLFCRPTRAQACEYSRLVGYAQDLVTSPLNVIDQGACLQAISELRKAANGNRNDIGAKLHVLGQILDALEHSNNEEKVVIASGSTRVLDLCQNMCASRKYPWFRLDGQTPQEKRQSSVTAFNKFSRKRAFVFMLSTRSGGLGLNLTGASRLILLDCDWNPSVDAQVMARIHRDGQRRPCYIYRLLTTGTIDEKIFQRQLSKIGLSENVLLDLSGASATMGDFSRETLQDLFRITFPQKCDTLEKAGGVKGQIKGYRELANWGTPADDSVADDSTAPVDPVMARLRQHDTLISCVLQKSTRSP